MVSKRHSSWCLNVVLTKRAPVIYKSCLLLPVNYTPTHTCLQGGHPVSGHLTRLTTTRGKGNTEQVILRDGWRQVFPILHQSELLAFLRIKTQGTII